MYVSSMVLTTMWPKHIWIYISISIIQLLWVLKALFSKRCCTCPLVFGCCELSQVIFLMLERKNWLERLLRLASWVLVVLEFCITWAQTISMAMCLISNPGIFVNMDSIRQANIRSYPWNKQTESCINMFTR